MSCSTKQGQECFVESWAAEEVIEDLLCYLGERESGDEANL